MPEGDTIFRSARALGRALTGHRVVAFDTAYAPLASVNDNTPVAGRTIEQVESRGKWLLIYFSGDLILVTHMLMKGSWHIYRRGERWRRSRQHMRLVIATEEFEAVAFDVPIARFHTARSLERQSAIPRLGPDLLGSGFSEGEAAIRLRARGDEEVAVALLNQQVMAGIGNVFKSEICFVCGVHPFRRVDALTRTEVDCLIDKARQLLALNVTETSGDGMITYTGARRTTGAADPGARLWVYGRQGRPCRRCGESVLMRKQGAQARSTYWCPRCQPIEEQADRARW
ncbi:Fpg/Nei family DNA glycosylase [Acidipila rosea]|uniref:DNA-(apurinic or apyrimidinic site) lyase n=1 Tax=Acidipila rosea TaxID=768535 RepID=A0A4R1KZ30_9BACT|nr:DNA-formamidopyrimidine glycosylase family protein [Acidipila rosea]TCK70796.1 DNA-(apurinic or apyrimidinic site) lyase /endonuclease VIII [Acidipila rosea]